MIPRLLLATLPCFCTSIRAFSAVNPSPFLHAGYTTEALQEQHQQSQSSPPSLITTQVSSHAAEMSTKISVATENKKNDNQSSRPKTIYLMRHAESLENVAYKGARRLQAAYVGRKLPELMDVIDAFKLTFKMFRPSVTNAALSDFGRNQVTQLHENLDKDGFWQKEAIQNGLVVHSPLLRAKQTAYGALWGPEHMDDDGTPRAEKILELPFLKEVNPAEIIMDAVKPWAKQKTIDYRIQELEDWLESRPEDTIVVVGHSVYFKRMLNLPKTFDNCDVWKATFVAGDDGGTNQKTSRQGAKGGDLPRSWTSLQRMYGLQPDEIPEVNEEVDLYH